MVRSCNTKEKDIEHGKSDARPRDASIILGGWAAGQGEGFLTLPAFLSLNKDGG